MWCLSHGDLCVRDLFTAYKCRCTRKGPKIRYKDVQKLEIKPKHPYCQEKMILWVKCCTFICFCPFMIDLSSLLLFCDLSFFILLILCRLVFFSLIIYFIPWFPHICLSFSLFCLQNLISLCSLTHFPLFLPLCKVSSTLLYLDFLDKQKKWRVSKIKITNI